MGVLTTSEINFQRLMDRSKRLCDADLATNVYKLKAALAELETLFSSLQDDRNLDHDILMQYGRDIYHLKLLVEAEQKRSPEERLRCVDLLPSMFLKSDLASRLMDEMNDGNHEPGTYSISSLKAKNKTIYRADLRKQLLSGGSQGLSTDAMAPNDFTEGGFERQEKLAEELLALTSLMKQTYTTANVVLKDDNVVLSRMQNSVEVNKSKLKAESRRLEDYAYRSWCDCLYLFGILLIIASFMGMIFVVKVFKKNY